MDTLIDVGKDTALQANNCHQFNGLYIPFAYRATQTINFKYSTLCYTIIFRALSCAYGGSDGCETPLT